MTTPQGSSTQFTLCRTLPLRAQRATFTEWYLRCLRQEHWSLRSMWVTFSVCFSPNGKVWVGLWSDHWSYSNWHPPNRVYRYDISWSKLSVNCQQIPHLLPTLRCDFTGLRTFFLELTPDNWFPIDIFERRLRINKYIHMTTEEARQKNVVIYLIVVLPHS